MFGKFGVILKRIFFKPGIPSALTAVSAFLVTLTGISLRWSDLLLIILLIALQIFLSYADKFSAKAVPLVKLTPGQRVLRAKWLKRLELQIAILPFLFLFNFYAVLLSVLIVWFLVIPYFSRTLMKFARRAQIREESLDQIRTSAPQVIIYVSGISGVAYQINQWLRVLEQLTVKPLILVRQRRVAEEMDFTNLPIFFARRMIDVETLYQTAESTVRVVLYPANTANNVQSLRHSQLLHFFINHGESDKSVNQSKLLMAYDKLLLAGPLAEKRLRKSLLPLREGQIEHVGRPPTELMLDQNNDNNTIKTLLYAPTWEGFVQDADYCSVNSFGLEMLNKLIACGEYRVLIKLHPFTGHRSTEAKNFLLAMKNLAKKTDVIQWFGNDYSIHELMNKSDLMICDISSVLNDYLVTRKPIILMNTASMSTAELEEKFPSTVACHVLDPETSVLDILNELKLKDIKKNMRNFVREQSLGCHPEGSLTRFTDVIARAVYAESEKRK